MTGESPTRIHHIPPHPAPRNRSTPLSSVLGEDLSGILPWTTNSPRVHIGHHTGDVAQRVSPQSIITSNSTNMESPGGDMLPHHHLIVGPFAHSIDQLGSSQRYSPVSYNPAGLSMVPCRDSQGLHGTPGQSLSVASERSLSVPEGIWANNFLWCQPQHNAVESPVSSWAEACPDNCFGDSNAEESVLMSPLVNPVLIPSSIDASMFSYVPYTSPRVGPALLTLQLSNNLLRPVEDPENEQIIQSLRNTDLFGDDDTDSAGSLTPSTPDSHKDITLGCADPVKQGHCNSEMVIGASHSCLAPTPQSSPRKSRPGDNQGLPSTPTTYGSKSGKKSKSKMHECPECGKKFPRPSGLVTHRNSHSGAKPFKCTVLNCDKSFTVRSNARRHLKTHGLNPAICDTPSTSAYSIGFEQPVVNDVHDSGKQPPCYKWIPQGVQVQCGDDRFRLTSPPSSLPLPLTLAKPPTTI